MEDEEDYDDAELVADDEDDRFRRPRLPLIERVAITTWPSVGVVTSGAITTGAVTGSATDMVVTGAAGLATEFMRQLHEVVRRERASRIDETIEMTAELSGESPQALIDQVLADPRLAELAETVLEAAALKAESVHRKALAKCLAKGLDDDVLVDSEILVARVLRDLTVPHVELLARLSVPQPKALAHYTRWPVYDVETLEKAKPGMVPVLDPLIGALLANGLVFQKVSAHFRKRDWTITDFGRDVLRRLEQEGLVIKRPRSEPIYPTRHRINFSGPADWAEQLAARLDDVGTDIEEEISQMHYADEDTDHVSGFLMCIGHTNDVEKVIRHVDTHANIRHMQGGGPRVVKIGREDAEF